MQESCQLLQSNDLLNLQEKDEFDEKSTEFAQTIQDIQLETRKILDSLDKIGALEGLVPIVLSCANNEKQLELVTSQLYAAKGIVSPRFHGFHLMTEQTLGNDLYSFVPEENIQINSNSDKEYKFIIRQQPSNGRVSGLTEKGVDKRPLDPIPILQLTIVDKDKESEKPILHNPFFFVYASLIDPETEQEISISKTFNARVMAGSVASSLYRMKDLDNSYGAFFVFPDISIREKGQYRLKFTLFEIASETAEPLGQTIVKKRSTVVSDKFSVYTSAGESSALTRFFAEQGLKFKIRKGPPSKKVTSKRSNEDSDESNSESQEPPPPPRKVTRVATAPEPYSNPPAGYEYWNRQAPPYYDPYAYNHPPQTHQIGPSARSPTTGPGEAPYTRLPPGLRHPESLRERHAERSGERPAERSGENPDGERREAQSRIHLPSISQDKKIEQEDRERYDRPPPSDPRYRMGPYPPYPYPPYHYPPYRGYGYPPPPPPSWRDDPRNRHVRPPVNAEAPYYPRPPYPYYPTHPPPPPSVPPPGYPPHHFGPPPTGYPPYPPNYNYPPPPFYPPRGRDPRDERREYRDAEQRDQDDPRVKDDVLKE